MRSIEPGNTAMTLGAQGVKIYQNIEPAEIISLDSRIMYQVNSKLSSLLTFKYKL